jgi:hypothetical protein
VDEQANFEPQPVLGPRRGGWRRSLLAVPIGAVIAAAWIGANGPTEDRATAEATTLPPTIARQEPSQPAPAWPATILGLAVRTIDQLDPRAVEDGADVAVAGWYVAWRSLGCPRRPGVEIPGFVSELRVNFDGETFCDRSGVLMSTPDPTGAASVSAVLTPGAPTQPDLFVAGGAPTAVIMVGRLRVVGSRGDRPSVGWQIAVDRVAWTNGAALAQTISILPRLLDQLPRQIPAMRDRVADATIGATGPILMETLVDPPTLAFVDPAAGAAVHETSPSSRRIWYRLALNRDARDAPNWIAIDDATGSALGAGIVGGTP